MKKCLLIFMGSLVIANTFAQDSIPEHEKVYRLNYKVEIPVTIGLSGAFYYQLTLLNQKSTLDINQINSLNKNDVWGFDRRALEQNYSYSSRKKDLNVSDWGLYVSILLPSLLFIDKKIQKDWSDVLLLYLETQSVGLNIYVLGGPMFTNRIRPFAYYPEIPMEDKLETGTTDSFFSGHTSMTATASFFMAKVISDYHPELGAKKWLLFAAALIPPTFVGYHRYRGFKHFPTDIALGTIVGAAVGILIPELHKVSKRKNNKLSIVPFAGGYSGLVMQYKF